MRRVRVAHLNGGTCAQPACDAGSLHGEGSPHVEGSLHDEGSLHEGSAGPLFVPAAAPLAARLL